MTEDDYKHIKSAWRKGYEETKHNKILDFGCGGRSHVITSNHVKETKSFFDRFNKKH